MIFDDKSKETKGFISEFFFKKKMEEQLFSACEKGNVEEVKKLLHNNNKTLDINWQDNLGQTPFYIACSKGYFDIVKELLNDSRVDVNKVNNDGTTPFHFSCRNGSIEIVKLLLNDQKVDIVKSNKHEATPFYIACQEGHLEIVKMLLNDKRVNINQPNKNGATPFYIACSKGHIEIVKILLNDEKVEINQGKNNGQTPFYIACHNGHIEVVKLLLNDTRVEISKEENSLGATPFYIACSVGRTEIVELLLTEKRVDINQSNKNGTTPFYIACSKGQTEVVKLLLKDERVEINKTKNNIFPPFFVACQNGHIEVVKLLANDQRIDINQVETEYKKTPFYIACKNGHTEVVKFLLNDKRINLDQTRDNGKTPFWVSYKEGQTEVTNVLRNEKRKLNFKEEIQRYNQNIQQNKDIINSIGNLRDILFYFSEDIILEIKRESIQNFVQAFENCQEDQKMPFFSVIETFSLNGEITRIFKDVGGMEILANSFIYSTKKTLNVLTPMRNIINQNQFFREYLGENSKFLQSLTTLLDETENIQSKLNFIGMFLSLAGYISDKEIVKTILENIIFPIIQNKQSSKESIDKVLDCLMESSVIDSSKSILLEFGTKEIIQPFVDNQNSDYHFIGCIIQAFLSSSDVNNSNKFGSNPTSPKVISKILDVIDTFINTVAQSYTYTRGYFIFCYNVLKALGSLARNEANMKELKNNGIVKKIFEFIQNRKDNLLKTSERTVRELSTLIWTLSFDHECKSEFLSNKIVEILKGFNVKDNESVKRAVDGAIFTLIGNQNQNRNERKGQVMISYCWTEKEKARGIAKYLQLKNIPVWIDIQQMEGNVLGKMAEAVEESSVILVFLSTGYKESQSCRTEAEYAYKLQREMVFIRAEENYEPRGWLGALLGNKLWYNPWKNLIFNEESFSPIFSQIIKILNQPEMIRGIDQDLNFNQTQDSTNNNHQNQQQQQQQILNLLEKIITKIDEFEDRLQKVETQNKENFETINQRFGKMEIQNKESFEKMETNFEFRFDQILEKFSEKKRKSMFGK